MRSLGPRSVLLVEIPDAEPAVRQHRERLDASAQLGCPAHITVLSPFIAPGKIDEAVLTQLEHLFAAVSGFAFRLDHTDWFDDHVLWLGPHDPRPFRALTERVFQAFPDFPPFEDQFDQVVPHLTVGHGHTLTDLRTAEESVRTHLPIAGHATAVTLMTQQSAAQQWTKVSAFALA